MYTENETFTTLMVEVSELSAVKGFKVISKFLPIHQFTLRQTFYKMDFAL